MVRDCLVDSTGRALDITHHGASLVVTALRYCHSILCKYGNEISLFSLSPYSLKIAGQTGDAVIRLIRLDYPLKIQLEIPAPEDEAPITTVADDRLDYFSFFFFF